MPNYVCKGAIMKCSMGSATANLGVMHPMKPDMLHGQCMANIMDNKPMVNIPPFGMCRSPLNPQVIAIIAATKGAQKEFACMPNIVAPWVSAKMNVLVKGQPALLNNSLLACAWAGTIEIKDTGVKPRNVPGLTKMKLEDPPEKEKQEQQAVISSLKLIDENNETLTGFVTQYVNLPKEDRFKDGDKISGVGVLGRKLRCKVKFNKEGSHNFTVKLTPDKRNAVYSEDEIGRKADFKYQDQELQFTTDANGEKIIDIGDNLTVSPAGGDLFTISATAIDDTGKSTTVKASARIRTKRMMYYVEAKMAGLTAITPDLDIFVKEYEKHGIIFKGLSSFEINHIPNISDNDGKQAVLQADLNTKYANSEGPQKEPYTIIVVYTDHLAAKRSNLRRAPIQAPNPSSITIDINAQLWINLVPGESWFIGCQFIEDATGRIHDIGENACIPISAQGNSNCFCWVRVDLSRLPNVSGKIELTVNAVDRWRLGLSLGGNNIVVIATRSFWISASPKEQNDTLIHEIGHQFGMAADARTVDRVPNQYTDRGHRGSHCHSGIALRANFNDGVSNAGTNCVMFGATNGHSDFCTDCAKATKKIDLSNGIG